MIILRPTQKLHDALPPTVSVDMESDTALGDWYVNRIVVNRRPLLVLVSVHALLPLLIPARDVRTLPARLPGLVAEALRRLDVAPVLIAAETAAMSPVHVAPTRDRSILGVLNDIAQRIPFHLREMVWNDATLPFVEARLIQTPWRLPKRSKEYLWPLDLIPKLLTDRWGAF